MTDVELDGLDRDRLSASEIRARYVTAVREVALERARVGEPIWLLPFRCVTYLLMAASLVLAPLAFRLIQMEYRRRRLRKPMLEALRFAERAQFAIGAPYTLNPALRSPSDERAPCTVVIAADGDVGLAELARWVGELEGSVATAHEGVAGAFDALLMFDVRYIPFRRRRLPKVVTGGQQAYLCDLLVEPSLLEGRCFSKAHPFVGCMFEPGDGGTQEAGPRIVQCPPWLISRSTPPPDKEQQQAFFTTLLMIDGLRHEQTALDQPVPANRRGPRAEARDRMG